MNVPPSGLAAAPPSDPPPRPHYGVLALPCEYGPPRKAKRGVLSSVARSYHYFCAIDLGGLPMLGVSAVKEPRVRLGPCPRCGSQYHGPRVRDLVSEAFR